MKTALIALVLGLFTFATVGSAADAVKSSKGVKVATNDSTTPTKKKKHAKKSAEKKEEGKTEAPADKKEAPAAETTAPATK